MRLNGVVANFTTHAAHHLDSLNLPYTKDGIFEENMLEKHFAAEILYDICHGREFWEKVPVYPWSWMLYERAFELSKQQVWFLGKAHLEDSTSWGGKAAWVHRNFGRWGMDHLIMSHTIENLSMLCNGKQDILVTCLKSEVDVWNLVGGTALYFPELDVRSALATDEVARRLTAMTDVVERLSTNAL